MNSLHKIVHAPTPQIKDFNAAAPADPQRIVRRCLAKDPEDRYQTIKDVAIELKELRREMESAAAEAGLSTPPETAADPYVFQTVGQTIDVRDKAAASTAEPSATTLAQDGLLVVEYHHKNQLKDAVGTLRRWRILKQGDSALSFFERA